MKPDESNYWQDWFDIAGRDLERVRRRLDTADPEDAAFHLQQALEKYLKGFLLHHGWALKRHHNLVDLLKEASALLPDLAEYRDLCQEVTGYYIIERYPLFMDFEISPDDLRKNLQRANELIEKLKGSGGI